MRPTPLLLAVIVAGGALGTTGRYAVSHLIPAMHPLPWATLLVNLGGAFLLGLLLEALSRVGGPTTRGTKGKRTTPARWPTKGALARIGLGTGLLGGLTSYSALALEVHDLLVEREIVLALGYGLGSVTLGLLVCAAGIWLGAQINTRHPGSPGRRS